MNVYVFEWCWLLMILIVDYWLFLVVDVFDCWCCWWLLMCWLIVDVVDWLLMMLIDCWCCWFVDVVDWLLMLLIDCWCWLLMVDDVFGCWLIVDVVDWLLIPRYLMKRQVMILRAMLPNFLRLYLFSIRERSIRLDILQFHFRINEEELTKARFEAAVSRAEDITFIIRQGQFPVSGHRSASKWLRWCILGDFWYQTKFPIHKVWWLGEVSPIGQTVIPLSEQVV